MSAPSLRGGKKYRVRVARRHEGGERHAPHLQPGRGRPGEGIGDMVGCVRESEDSGNSRFGGPPPRLPLSRTPAISCAPDRRLQNPEGTAISRCSGMRNAWCWPTG
ncbi:MAG: hypothetical protein BJ554DRAFT_5118 [Olpidium bornovanus]|uniref:Uncharacterized protein n=1 Tax=Olpidium bornovanus TaxID=278681 RepID=A0A8H7ZLU2_9FUNG|nr:MAG: hypothetical protein BJ554DRAFT_5118 [Olpidium bornovanus]